MSIKGGFIILDFGSQYTQLIARKLRELGVFSEIVNYDMSVEEIKTHEPAGIILSGGPNSVFAEDAPRRDVEALLKVAPVLGICYGMQLLAYELGGEVKSAEHREYGLNFVKWQQPLFKGAADKQKVWMSHGDVVVKAPPNFKVIAESGSAHAAAMVSERCWAVQFHPEVTHTENGLNLLEEFVFQFCKAKRTWAPQQVLSFLQNEAREKVGPKEKVLCALSGGVDSTAMAVLVTRALGAERVHCVFVDTGLLRKNEAAEVEKIYEDLGLRVHVARAEDLFLSRLAGVTDPEKKRLIIGHTFIDVFKSEIKKIGHMDFLAQGTLYPDVIESIAPRGTSVTIKTHHNVGGLPKDLNLKLLEPFRELFKDEVRAIGAELGIPERFLGRHPFPGPGLAIRIMGAINKPDLDILRAADAIYREEMHASQIYNEIWQAFVVLLPVQTVGVQGDARTYDRVIALRAVTSQDGMTADWYPFSPAFLQKVSSRITNEVKGVNRVVYDVTSKPPATIEWE